MTKPDESRSYNLTDIETVKKLLSQAGFYFQKSLGQNFITDATVCPKMVSLSGIQKTDAVLEIGAGVGVLTTQLAEAAKKVVSVEVDSRLLPVLAKTLYAYRNAFVVNGDILKTDLDRLLDEHFEDEKIFVCANLPYYITSPIIMTLLKHRERIKSMTLMVQKEAADRLCAEVGSRDSGAITAAVHYYAEVKKLFDVKRTSYTPAPQVDSAVIRLDILEKPPVTPNNEEFFFAVIKAAFSQRRKTAANGLASMLGLQKSVILNALQEAGLSPSVRAEALSMEQLCLLTDCLEKNR